jgi:F-type H+-transporting ATPase subunit b
MENETEAAEGAATEAVEHAAEGAGHGAETLGEEVLAHAEVGMPQLDPTIFPNLIFWLVVSLVVLYLILTKVALPRISTVLAERHDAIANDLEAAALFKRRAQEAEAAYNRALAEAREESQRIAAETKAGIQKELKALMAKADAEIAAKSAESERRIVEIRASATQSVEEVARSTAVEIVQALMPSLADADAAARAVSDRMKG